MQKELILSVEIPNYPRKIRLAESRRAKYYEVGDDIPKYLQHNLLNGAAQYRERVKNKPLCLFDTITKEFIISNPRVAGTPRDEVINGQKIYNGGYHPNVRDKIMNFIHNHIIEAINKTPIAKYVKDQDGDTRIKQYPLHIECEIHDLKVDPISKNKPWDAINRGYPWCKAFDDVLVNKGFIPDDNINYVVCPCHPIFFPIGESETPKLVFKVYHIIKEIYSREIGDEHDQFS